MESKTQIFRQQKTRNYTIVNNEILRRKDLSWKAKGILVYILSLPNDWVIYLEEVMKHSTDGRDSFRSGWKELETAGYVKRFAYKEKGVIKEWRTIVSESAELSTFSPDTDFPEVEKPQVDNPEVENPKLQSTDIQSTNKPITDNKNKSRKPAKAAYDDASPYMVFAKEFFSEIKKNNNEAKEPNYQRWADDIRKLVELDGKSIENARNVMIWSQKNSFWKGNILSAKKLREKYDQLKVQSGNFKARQGDKDPNRYVPKELRGKERNNGKGFTNIPSSARQDDVSSSIQNELEDFI